MQRESPALSDHPASAVMLPLQAVSVGDCGLPKDQGEGVCLCGVRMISDQRADEAFEYLRDTTDAIGAAKAELERSEILRKRTRKRLFLGAPDGSIAMREAFAEVQGDTEAADDRYVEAVSAFEALRARRDVETIALDVWRTESANRRRA